MATPPTPDTAALLERCRLNLVGYDEAMRRGQPCACVVRRNDQFLAVATDGDELVCDTTRQVVAFLLRKGVVASEQLTMPPWQEGDIAPAASEQIAIRSMLRLAAASSSRQE